MANKIIKGDEVVFLTGKDKGKTGKVLKVFPKENKLIVAGLNKAIKHMKAKPGVTAGGRVEIEMKYNASNVAILDPKEKKPTRVGFKFLEDGKKVRFAKLSGEIL